MKYAILGFIVVMSAFGVSVAFTAAINYSDERQVQEYIDSRGAAPIPRTWQGKIGKGI